MNTANHSSYFLLILLAAALIIVYFVVQPFLGPLILASVFAFLFHPLYVRISTFLKHRESIAALLTTIIAIVVVMLPITLLGSQIFLESNQLYHTLADGEKDSFSAMAENLVNQARTMVNVPDNYEINLGQYVQQILDVLIQNIGAVFSSVAGLVMDFFVFLVAFYFLLKDGKRLKEYWIALSPLEDHHDEKILGKIGAAVSSVVKGSLSIGIIQGILTAIGFALFGVPNAVLWGSVAAVAALIPGVGTALVLGPAIGYLYFTGNTVGSIGLLAWGGIAVGLVDNLLGPTLMGSGMKMHPLAVFLTVIGGLAFFGPLGFILGPLSLSLCFVLIDIYFSFKNREITTR